MPPHLLTPLLAPLAWLLQAIVHRDRATPCTVLRVCTLTEWATPDPRPQAHRSHVRRGSGTIAELKIDLFLVPSTSLLQLSDVSSHALLDTQAGRSNKHTNRHTSTEKAHSEPSYAQKMHSANPIHMCQAGPSSILLLKHCKYLFNVHVS